MFKRPCHRPTVFQFYPPRCSLFVHTRNASFTFAPPLSCRHPRVTDVPPARHRAAAAGPHVAAVRRGRGGLRGLRVLPGVPAAHGALAGRGHHAEGTGH